MHFDYLSSWASTSPLNKEKLRKNNLIGIKIGEVRWKQKCLIWFWWTLRSTNLKKKMLYVHHIQYLYLHHLFWTSSNYPIPKKKLVLLCQSLWRSINAILSTLMNKSKKHIMSENFKINFILLKSGKITESIKFKIDLNIFWCIIAQIFGYAIVFSM